MLVSSLSADLPDLTTVPTDLMAPPLVEAAPAPRRRVRTVTTGWEGTEVHHALYLPPEWRPQSRLPVLVELPGNGSYRNAFGDACDGTVASCLLGYGISGGSGFVWVSVPLVEISKDGVKRNAVKWWGNLEESKRYLTATVREICARWGGDAERVILCGFSRGSIGCNFVGLHDDEIAGMWRAFICHSHYDGVITKWPYRGADRATALRRLQRLGDRPQWISHEGSMTGIGDYLESTGVKGNWTLVPLPFRNHSAEWVLRPLPERQRLRDWLAAVLD
jgi:hypothetical protein